MYGSINQLRQRVETEPGGNRRVFARVRAGFPAIVVGADGAPLPESACRVVDMSIGGLLIHCTSSFPQGTLLNISLRIPGEADPIIADASVITVRAHKGGQRALHCRFVNLTGPTLRKVTAWVRARS